MGKIQYFSIVISAILLVDSVSAGLLQTIRQEAAFLKDAIQDSLESIDPSISRDPRALAVENHAEAQKTESASTSTSSLFDITSILGLSGCSPGDFVCLAQRNMKTGVQNEMSNAIVKSVATIMTDMLNSTISRSIVDMTIHAQNSKDPKEAEQARAAMSAATGALSMVSSKVIQAFAYFVKVSISGVMWDLFHQMMRAAKSSAMGSLDHNGKAKSALALGTQPQQSVNKEALNFGIPMDSINPSNFNGNNNNLRRVSPQ